MPAHFTHIYMARRVAQHLVSDHVQDWVGPQNGADPTFQATVGQYGPRYCGEVMQRWEKFTAIGAIGPDLFYFSQDYSSKVAGTIVPPSDEIMLALAIYYFYQTNKEENWEPLLIILDKVNSTLGALVRFILKLEQIWKDFLAVWQSTIGPFVSAANSVLDDLTGGVITAFGDGIQQLKNAIEMIGKEEVLTFFDIFGSMDTGVAKGFDEQSLLWGDVLHYRRTTLVVRRLIEEAEALRATDHDQFEQLLAFALGWMTHVGTDTVAHSYVNEQCGGPFRNHPQRHHLIENHLDAWNYRRTLPGGALPPDPWAANGTYPDLTNGAIAYFVHLNPANPQGDQRPATLPDDPVAAKAALSKVDGEMPMWMAEAIVRALKATYGDDTPREDATLRRPHTHPRVYKGDAFQQAIDGNVLSEAIRTVTGHGPDAPLPQLLNDITPASTIGVPEGFPLPWQVQGFYRLMLTYYRLSYVSTWKLDKPRRPHLFITPPASDVSNLLSPPDFSGASSGDPVEDACNALKSLFEWAGKELGAALKLAGDLVKMVASPGSYPIRLALYELAMMVWDVVQKTHEILAHLGFYVPHGELRYPDGELMLGNEIDDALITLGRTTDGTFQQALADAIDPFGHLDRRGQIPPTHEIGGPAYPYYQEGLYDGSMNPQRGSVPPYGFDTREYRRPWAYPDQTPAGTSRHNDLRANPSERQAYPVPPLATDPDAAAWQQTPDDPPVTPGPYASGSTPDRLFRTDVMVDAGVRADYEQSTAPARTDELNKSNVQPEQKDSSPLGDPIPFSSYLIGRILNDRTYSSQFNLDSDRAFGYLTWDWARQRDITETADLGFAYRAPQVWPQLAPQWVSAPNDPMRLVYIDKPQSSADLLGARAAAALRQAAPNRSANTRSPGNG